MNVFTSAFRPRRPPSAVATLDDDGVYVDHSVHTAAERHRLQRVREFRAWRRSAPLFLFGIDRAHRCSRACYAPLAAGHVPGVVQVVARTVHDAHVEQRDRRPEARALPVYGCVRSGKVHVCDPVLCAPRCHETAVLTDGGDQHYVCIFSGRVLQKRYVHEEEYYTRAFWRGQAPENGTARVPRGPIDTTPDWEEPFGDGGDDDDDAPAHNGNGAAAPSFDFEADDAALDATLGDTTLASPPRRGKRVVSESAAAEAADAVGGGASVRASKRLKRARSGVGARAVDADQQAEEHRMLSRVVADLLFDAPTRRALDEEHVANQAARALERCEAYVRQCVRMRAYPNTHAAAEHYWSELNRRQRLLVLDELDGAWRTSIEANVRAAWALVRATLPDPARTSAARRRKAAARKLGANNSHARRLRECAVGTLYTMRHGYRLADGTELLPSDPRLRAHLPEAADLHRFGGGAYQTNHVTNGKRLLVAAIAASGMSADDMRTHFARAHADARRGADAAPV